MKQTQIIQMLKFLGAKVPSNQPRTGWVISNCPLGPWRHEDGKSSPEVFGVKVENGDPFCNCFACGFAGPASKLIVEMQYANKKDFKQKLEFNQALQLIADAESDLDLDLNIPTLEEMLAGNMQPKFIEYPEWWLGSFPKWSEIGWARKYVENRFVPEVIADALDLRADTAQKRVCFPVRDFGSKLMGLHGRATVPDTEPRYRMYTFNKQNNPLIWLGEHWVDLDKPIVVVEGPFDLTSVLRVYRNVVCPLFVNPSHEKLDRMTDATQWITFFDRGKGGDSGRQRVSQYLKKHAVEHVKPPEGRKDPGECSVDDLIELLGNRVPLDEILD